MNIQNLQEKKVHYWQWIKGWLFTSRSNKVFNKVNKSLCDYSDAYILVTRNIAVTRTIAAAGNNPIQRNQPLAAATQVAFKNCAPFNYCRTKVNDTFLNHADFINTEMSMCNLIKYSDKYLDTSGSLWGLKKRWGS